MKCKNVSIVIITFSILFILTFSINIQAASPREQLKQYVADLQRNPDDYALREKIIKFVQTMEPKPSIPEDARRHFVKAATMQKESKDVKGFGLAVKAYKQALHIAPWWADAYYNLSIALELSGQYDESIKAIKLYLLTNPGDSDVRTAQDRIYAIEAKKELSQAQETEKRGLAEDKKRPSEINRDGRFIAYEDGTVLDTRTKLMWAKSDNAHNINWYDAKSYCKNYRGGGYTDWRMPTQHELAGLFDRAKRYYMSDCGFNVLLTELIRLTCSGVWAAEAYGSDAASFNFNSGSISTDLPADWYRNCRALPVRYAR